MHKHFNLYQIKKISTEEIEDSTFRQERQAVSYASLLNMLSRPPTSCFHNDQSQGYGGGGGGGDQDHVHATNDAISSSHDSTSLLYSLSLLKDKVHQLHSLLNTLLFPHHQTTQSAESIAIATTATLIQEIIVTASSMMFTCQQMALISPANPDESQVKQLPNDHAGEDQRGQLGWYSTHDHDQTLDWYGANNYNPFDTNDNNNNRSDDQNLVVTHNNGMGRRDLDEKSETKEGLGGVSPKNYDIIELEAADLLAKYTHYCKVCGKGFKRDANLRMHMRAHGDEYKSNAALVNPMKNSMNGSSIQGNKEKKQMRMYSCPHEGCRWNRKHEKFQPLKSMICVKNHYKRSHCPKMYVCNRCNRKQFSVLSDLRTHEKHCGDLRWRCSCGTTFSRKDKLMGHVALFCGHSPVISSPVVKDQKSSTGKLKDVVKDN